MPDKNQLAQTFHDLHKKGDPIILYNIWDAGSAEAVRDSGAKAIATGSHGVANAHGYEDGENIPLDVVLTNAKRIVEVIDQLPVTMDIETGYGQTPADVAATVKRVIETGVVGVNFEDQLFGQTQLRDIADQAARIAAIRAAADEAHFKLFINARSDLFKNTPPEQHNAELLAQAIERAKAYAAAGANGFFLPGISDLELIRTLCAESPIPVNIIMLPSVPPAKELAAAGVGRISYGPVPYLQMIDWLKDNAKTAIGGLA